MDAKRLQKVEDVLEIQGLKALYFEILDDARLDREKAAVRLREIFAEDVKADYGARGVVEGRDNVIKLLLDASTKPSWLWHSLHSPRVEVDGDMAVGRWTGNGQGKMSESDEVASSTNRYLDDFRRTPKGWRFAVIRNINEG